MTGLEWYVNALKRRMGLRDWRITVKVGPQDVEAYDFDHVVMATCSVTYGKKEAVLQFSPEWESWTQQDLRRTVVHELVHCHLEPMRWMFNNAVQGRGVDARSVLEPAFVDQLEIAVDGIAEAWSKVFPLPQIGESDADKDAEGPQIPNGA